MESATCQGELGITDGAAPVTLDGVGGAAGACEEEGESVAKVAELAEVVCAAGLTIEEGDGLESDEGDVGCVGTGPGDGVLRPFREHVEVGALLPELSAVDGIGVELAGADHVPVVEEVVLAPADVKASVLGILLEGKG